MPTNQRQQKGWEFGETPWYKTVATSVYIFGTEIESWEVWTSQLSSVACNILQMKHNTHYGVLRQSFWVGGHGWSTGSKSVDNSADNSADNLKVVSIATDFRW